jgi:phosphate transport system substrate-binding protein
MSVRAVSITPFCLLAMALSVFMLASQAGAGELDRFTGLRGSLNIAGGTAHIPVMKESAKRIMTHNPEIRITVAGGGTGVGVQQAGEGLVDIGNTGRALTPAEVEKYGLVSFPFAIDGVAVVVNPRNPVSGITAEQVRRIYAGGITNWREVGGPDGPIHLYTRDEASGTREVFWDRLLKKGETVDAANVVASNGAMKTAVAQDDNAIGYVSIGHLDQTVKAPDLDGVEPSQENASSGVYPVTRKLFMNTRGEPQGLTRAFIDYILGPEGAEITKSSGYIPVK